MKIAILSSLAMDTGCWLRAQYLGKSLEKAGNEIVYIKPMKKTMHFMLDLFLSFFKNFKLLFVKADIAIGIKPYPNATIPLLIKKLFGSKVVIDIDDLDYGYRKGLISLISKFIQKPFPKFFDVVTYHNNNLRKFIVNDLYVSNEKLYKLDQGVDFDLFDFEKYRPKKYSKKKILVYAGHLNIASNLDDILEAFKIVLKKRDDIKLIVTGGGPMENYFKKIAKKLKLNDKVSFTGFIPQTQKIVEYISRADICLVYYKDNLPNRYRCSMKLREYLAMKKIVVCNKVGDLKEFKRFTYQSNNSVEDFAKKILEVLNNKTDERAEIGRNFVLKKYSWDIIGRKFSKKLQGNL